MITPKYKHSALTLTGKIINYAMAVHRERGNGLQKVIYQRALAHESDLRHIPFKREYEMTAGLLQTQTGRQAKGRFSG